MDKVRGKKSTDRFERTLQKVREREAAKQLQKQNEISTQSEGAK
jgi:hypothetical protein